MKPLITGLACLLLGTGIGWFIGYSRPVAKNQRELLRQYEVTRDTAGLSDEDMRYVGSHVHEFFQDVKRQDETAARYALGAYQILEKGETERAKSRLLQAIGSYYRVYREKGGDTNLLKQIEDAARKYPAVDTEIHRKLAEDTKAK